MKGRLLAAASVTAALLLPAGAGAKLAKANQFEGAVGPNSCGAVHDVTVSGQKRIDAVFAGTNVGGLMYAQILDSAGNVVSDAGAYTTPGAGTYGVRACFTTGDGIDDGSQVDYVGMITTG